jgi:hypothetical protein
MINIDTRLIDTKSSSRINEKELWLLVHVAKRINMKNLCWPSNDLLLNDTGWHIEKLQSVKKSLVKKGLIEIFRRGDKSNVYKINTEFLGVFVTCKGEWQEQNESNFSIDGKSDTYSIDGKSGLKGTGKTNNEVLTTEALTIIPESNDSVTQKPVFVADAIEIKTEAIPEPEKPSDDITTKKARAKQKTEKEKDIVFTTCVDFWLKEFHTGWTFGAMQGKALKSLLVKIKAFCINASLQGTDAQVINSFKKMCHMLPDWFKDKDLNLLDQKFNEIMTQIQQGPKTGGFSQQNSAAMVFGKYGLYGKQGD